MKKIIISTILTLMLPSIVLAFTPATLFKNADRVAVYTRAQADKLFGQGYKLEQKSPILGIAAATGTVNIKWVQSQPYTLAGSGAALGATTITLKSFKNIDGSLLTMTNFGSQGFGTLEPGNALNEEQITFTGITQNANGTAVLTGVSRVLNIYPYTETSGTAVTHSGGTKFVLSNTAGFYNTFANKENDERINGLYRFTYRPTTTISAATDPSQIATINDIITATTTGGVNASELVKGISELATGGEAASSTLLGGTAARLVIPTSITTSTAGNINVIPVTNSTTRIDAGFYQGNNNTWTATNTFASSTSFTASTTINGNKLIGAVPNTVYITASTTWVKPTGVSRVRVKVLGAGGTGGNAGTGNPGGGGSAGGYAEKVIDISATSSIFVTIGDNDGVNGTSSFMTVICTGGGNGLSNTTPPAGAAAPGSCTGGDLNITGQYGGYTFDATGASEGGDGASSIYGVGGPGGKETSVNGLAGSGYGAGGGGGSSTTGVGGAGSKGLVIIEY